MKHNLTIGIGVVAGLFVASQFSVWWFSSSHLDPEVAEALEEDRASWPEPSTDDAKEALAFWNRRARTC